MKTFNFAMLTTMLLLLAAVLALASQPERGRTRRVPTQHEEPQTSCPVPFLPFLDPCAAATRSDGHQQCEVHYPDGTRQRTPCPTRRE